MSKRATIARTAARRNILAGRFDRLDAGSRVRFLQRHGSSDVSSLCLCAVAVAAGLLRDPALGPEHRDLLAEVLRTARLFAHGEATSGQLIDARRRCESLMGMLVTRETEFARHLRFDSQQTLRVGREIAEAAYHACCIHGGGSFAPADDDLCLRGPTPATSCDFDHAIYTLNAAITVDGIRDPYAVARPAREARNLLFRCIVGNPYRPMSVHRDDECVAMAKACAVAGDRLAAQALADKQEEAGKDEAAACLRRCDFHVDCHVVRAILAG